MKLSSFSTSSSSSSYSDTTPLPDPHFFPPPTLHTPPQTLFIQTKKSRYLFSPFHLLPSPTPPHFLTPFLSPPTTFLYLTFSDNKWIKEVPPFFFFIKKIHQDGLANWLDYVKDFFFFFFLYFFLILFIYFN